MSRTQYLPYAFYTTFTLVAALVFCFSLWHLLFRPSGPSWLFWLVQCMPIALVVPGMWLRQPRAFIWLCFLMLMYFVKGVDGLVFPSRAWIDYVILIASIVIFCSAMLTARWLQQSPPPKL